MRYLKPTVIALALVALSLPLMGIECDSEDRNCSATSEEPFDVEFLITAYVRDADGNPLEDVPVRIEGWKDDCEEDYRQAVGLPQSGRTLSDGSFTANVVVGFTIDNVLDDVFFTGTIEEPWDVTGTATVEFGYMTLSPTYGTPMPVSINISAVPTAGY